MPVLTVSNFATNPRPLTGLDTGTGAWEYVAGTGELGTSAAVASAGPVGLPGFAQRTITTAKTAGISGWAYSEASGGAAGSTRDVSMYVRAPADVSIVLRVAFLLGGVDAGYTDTVPLTIPANAWTRIEGNGGAVGSFDEVRAWAYTSSPVPTGTFSAACVFIDPGTAVPVLEPYPSVFFFPNDNTFPEA